MDRDELQERIRARRSGGDPYRRGAGAADDASAGYQRYEPDPTDVGVARRGEGPPDRRADYFDERAAAASAPQPRAEERPDLTRERDEWGTPVAAGTAAAASEAWTPAPDEEGAAYAPEPRTDNYLEPDYDDEAAEYPYEYEYDAWQEPERRSSGAGAFAILGFLALGVLALLGGAILAGVFGGDPGVAQGSPTPSLTASLAPEVSSEPSAPPSAAASAEPGGSLEPIASGDPVAFDDGATFEVQACATNEMTFDGCAQQAEFFSGGSFVAWVGFSRASGDDTLLLVLRQDGAAVADSEFVLGDPPFSCGNPCTGYARQGFTGLPPGEYTVELLRNGEPAHAIRIGID